MNQIAQVPVSDAGFRHGVGVFETLRVGAGKARWHEWHLESIRESAKALGLKIKEEELEKVPLGDGLWRWFVTDTGTRTWWSPGLEALPQGFSLDPAELGLWSGSWEARYKTLSYLLRIQAGGSARTKKDREVAMVNEKGELASASMANLFWVKGGRLRTPARECGCRAGTVRRWVLERSEVKAEEGRWHLGELDGAEEIFLTNARIGIQPVLSWRGTKMAKANLAQRLAEMFWAE